MDPCGGEKLKLSFTDGLGKEGFCRRTTINDEKLITGRKSEAV